MRSREWFDFVVDGSLTDEGCDEYLEKIQKDIQSRHENYDEAKEEAAQREETMFMKAFIPSTMADVFDLDRDLGLMKKGDTESIYYAKVTGINLIMPAMAGGEEHAVALKEAEQ